MFSTLLLEAASSSCMLYERPSLNAIQDSHLLQGSLDVVSEQLIAFARIRAVVVLPTPRGPQKR